MIFFQWNWIRDFGWREQRNQNMAPRSVNKRVVTKEASSSPEIDKVKQRVSFFLSHWPNLYLIKSPSLWILKRVSLFVTWMLFILQTWIRFTSLTVFFTLQKKKLTDKLGPQWTKGELERFYEAYRKHGRDWKKVTQYMVTFSTFVWLQTPNTLLHCFLGSCCGAE